MLKSLLVDTVDSVDTVCPVCPMLENMLIGVRFLVDVRSVFRMFILKTCALMVDHFENVRTVYDGVL